MDAQSGIPPQSGEELIDTIMERKAISEFRWTTVDEILNKGGTLGRVCLSDSLKWWEAFPEKTKKRISEAWGNPPGEEVNGIPPAMVYEDTILVTGVDYGNAVVCMQPKRGCAGPKWDGRVCKILHDPDVPPPHQYLATYRYLEDTFGTHVVVHVGTHGNIEFLPGKGVGLPESCMPDLSIHTLEHMIIDSIEKTDLAMEIRFRADDPFEETLRKTHEALSRIRNTQIQDGTHVFGCIPQGEQRIDFIRKHAMEKIREENGTPDDRQAWRQAAYRVFSSKPGTYMPGVKRSSIWKSRGGSKNTWAMSRAFSRAAPSMCLPPKTWETGKK